MSSGFDPPPDACRSKDARSASSVWRHGPMGRSVRDVAALLSVQAGYDPRALFSTSDDERRFCQPLGRDFKNTRIGYLGDLDGYLAFEPGVLSLCESATKAFENLGCVVEPVV